MQNETELTIQSTTITEKVQGIPNEDNRGNDESPSSVESRGSLHGENFETISTNEHTFEKPIASTSKTNWGKITNIRKRRRRPFTVCYRCGQRDHYATDPKCPGHGMICNRCEQVGHSALVCMKEPIKQREERCQHCYNPKHNTEQCNYCHLCNHWGHHYQKCPLEEYVPSPTLSEILREGLTEEEILNSAMDEFEETLPKKAKPELSITIDENNLWTFVYHGPAPIIKNYRGDVIIVEHDNKHEKHYHFVFTSSPKNKRRTIERIHKNLLLDNLSESVVTCQPIRNWKQFAAYLVRKFHYQSWLIGTKLSALYTEMKNTPANERECAELNRLERRQNERGTTLFRKQRTNVLMDLIKQHDARHLHDLKKQLDCNMRLTLYHEFGIQWQETAKLCIEVYNEELNREQSCLPFEIYVQRKNHSPCDNPTNFEESDEWLTQLLLANNIEPVDFIRCVHCIMNKVEERRNALVIEGPTTTGKSLMLKLICSNYNYGTVQRSGDHSQFFLQNLVNKTVALMEEPRITAITVNDFKELLGGNDFDIHIKHQDDIRLERLPVLISTNHNLGEYIQDVDKEAIYMRCHTFKFIQQIGKTVPLPPDHLCTCHFAHWYLRYGGFFESQTPA